MKLFSSLNMRSVTFNNRIFISPMCLYSAENGIPNDFHFVHLGSFAIGKAALVMTEATAVSPEGRISNADTGMWNDEQEKAFARITQFIKKQGSIPAIQLGHAGRKASTEADWKGGKLLLPEQGGWETVAPSAIPFKDTYSIPIALSKDGIGKIMQAFEQAAIRSDRAGFEVLEIHMAHGYLLHQFLSPISNHRNDEYGGSFENRVRFPLQLAKRIRNLWPNNKPLFVRISATDWVDNGWNLEDSIEFSKLLKVAGIDLIDCSSGGAVAKADIPVAPHFQVPFAAAIRKKANICTGAVGLITEAKKAESILQNGDADVIFIAREALRSPHWPLLAANELKCDISWPVQYERAKIPF